MCDFQSSNFTLSRGCGQQAHLSRPLQFPAPPPSPQSRCLRSPADWLGDQTLAYRQARRLEEEVSLDLPALARRRRARAAEPTAAFGPAGSTGEQNISIVVAPIYEGFKLRDLGTPTEAAQRLLLPMVAPEGSDRTASLLTSTSRTDANGQLYYFLEFSVSSPKKFSRHNLTVYTSRDDLLYTLTLQCPTDRWQADKDKLLASAASFELLPAQANAFPGRL